jgi:hypothetical protein
MPALRGPYDRPIGSRRETLLLRVGAASLAVVAATLIASTIASAATFPPKGRQLYMGVSDGGSKTDYFRFAKAAGQHLPVLQAFETWSAWNQEAIKRWKRTESRGMLSISTAACYQCSGVISPRGIRKGDGDRYLLTVNRKLAQWGRPTYIRLLPEMNGHWNPYAAYDADGSGRGRSHKTAQFRKAWKRSVIIIRGGPRKKINRKLKRNKMPPLKTGRKGNGPPPKHIPQPKVSFMWVPQTAGSPNIKGNGPRAYWPGGRYVDWIGADIYGKYPNFTGLNWFYRHYKRKPVVIGEWSPWDVDNPGFTRRLGKWMRKHDRAKMAVYYQGFGPGNPYQIRHYPASKKALRRELKRRRWVSRAPASQRPDGGGHSRGGPDGVPPPRWVRGILGAAGEG